MEDLMEVMPPCMRPQAAVAALQWLAAVRRAASGGCSVDGSLGVLRILEASEPNLPHGAA